MSREDKIRQFDPNGVGLKNGHFIGLPFTEEEAQIVLLSVPWDVTVSYSDGTSRGPENILQASTQLDLYDPEAPDAWKMGLYLRPPDTEWQHRNDLLRSKAKEYLAFLEAGGDLHKEPEWQVLPHEITRHCTELVAWVQTETAALLEAGKCIGIVGGEHSVPLGFLRALSEVHDSFGILQIDAHMDLREAYEGFRYSHASIFYNALQIKAVSRLVQVGIRDYCQEEKELADGSGGRVVVHYDHDLRTQLFQGRTYDEICRQIVDPLPEKVYVSFDIDGLAPELCPNTGTPVPGGLQFQEAMHLLKVLVDSGRQIIGFDLCEVAGIGHEWDGNVGARVLYRLANLMGKSNGLAG